MHKYMLGIGLFILVGVLLFNRVISFVDLPRVPADLRYSFQLEYGKPPAVDITFGCVTGRFIIDTGASDSAIDAELARKIGIKRSYGYHFTRFGTLFFNLIRQVTLASNAIIGNHELSSIRWMEIRDGFQDIYDNEYAGIIGRDVLAGFVIYLDYEHGIGMLKGSNVAEEEYLVSKGISLPMDNKANIKLIIDGKERVIKIDSGGAFTMRLYAYPRSLEWRSESAMQEVALGHRGTKQLGLCVIPSVGLGEINILNIAAQIIPSILPSDDGMIGSLFLEEGKFAIDFINHRILYSIRDDYFMDREAGSVIETLLVLPPIPHDDSGQRAKFKILSIYPENPLASRYGLRKADTIVMIDDKPLIMIHPSQDKEAADYLLNVALLRFRSLVVERDGEVLSIVNDQFRKSARGVSP